MRPLFTAPVLLTSFALLLAVGCAAAGAATDKEVLISLTDRVVVPSYQSLANDAARLDSDAAALCASSNDEALESARESWHAARSSWMKSQAVSFGPVMERRSVSLLDWSPTDTAGMDEFLASGDLTDAAQVKDVFGSNRRGFGAVEYLLFRPDALDKLADSPAYCAYLVALTGVVREEATGILAEWVDGSERRGPYQDYFTDRADSSLLPVAAVEQVVRIQVFLIRDIVQMRLASAVGLREGGVDLSAIPGTAAGHGLTDLRQEILGMQAVYAGSGPDARGISHLVQPLSEETDQRLKDQFAAALDAIDSVEGPLRVAAVQRPQQVNALYERLAAVELTLSTEVVSLLGVSVGFSDSDGDVLR